MPAFHPRIAVACLIPALLAACGTEQLPAPADAPQPVRVTTVEPVDTSQAIDVTGLVAGESERRLAFKASGVIAAVNVNEGVTVMRGAVLAELAPDEVESQQAQAQEAEQKARRDVERARNLQERGLLSLQQVQDAETALASASAQLRAARFTREHARIVAPSAGMVLRRLAEPGETIAAGVPVLVFADAGAGWVLRAGVPDRQAVRLRVGDRAEVRVDAWPDKAFAGRVHEIAAASDAGTGTLAVEIAFSGGGVRLLSGLVGSARITASVRTKSETTRHGTLAIPVGALLEAEGDAAHVFVLDETNAAARRVNVTTAGLQGDIVVITGGLQAGDKVVSEGAAWLRDGSAVNVIP